LSHYKSIYYTTFVLIFQYLDGKNTKKCGFFQIFISIKKRDKPF